MRIGSPTTLPRRSWIAPLLVLILTFGSITDGTAQVSAGFSLLASRPLAHERSHLLLPWRPEVVDLVGVPIGPGGADTIIQTFDPPLDETWRSAAIVAHAARGVAPVAFDGHEFDLLVTLDPTRTSEGAIAWRGPYADVLFDLHLLLQLQVRGHTVHSIPFSTRVGAIDDEFDAAPPEGYPVDPRYPPNGFFPRHLSLRGWATDDYRIGNLVPVPEPSAGGLALLGLAAVGAAASRRRR